MAIQEGVTIDGEDKLDEFLRRLTDPTELQKFVQNVGVEFGEKARVLLEDYPGPPSYPIRWASEKQRRWYFAHRRQTGYGLPYDRLLDPESQQLGMNWETKKTPDGAVVGNKTPYAAYVQGWQTQEPMHAATGWVTEKVAAESVFTQSMATIINQEMQRVLRGLVSGLGL